MAEIIGVRFKREGKQYYFDPAGHRVFPGDGVIVETSWGLEYGECARGNSQVPDEELVAPLRPVIRLATEQDLELVRRNRERERQAFRLCQEKIQQHKLDMKLVEVEYSFEGGKILFFFTSDGRVDFRGLVKDLAAAFHTRIELRQIGVRDEARMLGGLGICGREFCCASFLKEFQPVSIKMAKTQSLSLNPAKISGSCGRLMCCLKYEQYAYEDLLRTSPKADSFVETPDGVGDIVSVNTLREKVRVRLDSAPDSLKVYHNDEIRVVRSGKGRRPEGYVAPPLAELAALRRAPDPTEAEVSPSALRAPGHYRSLEETEGQERQERRPGGEGGRGSRQRNDRRREQRPVQPEEPRPQAGTPPIPGEAPESRENRRGGRRPKRPGRPNGQQRSPGQEQRPPQAAPQVPREEQQSPAAPVGGGEKPASRRKWRPRRPGNKKKPPQGEPT